MIILRINIHFYFSSFIVLTTPLSRQYFFSPHGTQETAEKLKGGPRAVWDDMALKQTKMDGV
jgi:hypothetical protein